MKIVIYLNKKDLKNNIKNININDLNIDCFNIDENLIKSSELIIFNSENNNKIIKGESHYKINERKIKSEIINYEKNSN